MDKEHNIRVQDSYRFLLYNIRYAAGAGLKFHTPFPFSGYIGKTDKQFGEIINYIKTLNPDLVGLIEVDGGSRRSRGLNQAQQMATGLGHSFVFQTKYDQPLFSRYLPIMRKQGNAFLAKDGILSQHNHYFDIGVKRLVIEIELDNVIVFLVHLSVKYKHRHEQLKKLSLLIRGVKKPVIVGGDFNIFMGYQELNFFLDQTKLESANTCNVSTFPSRVPRWELDFILHSPQITVNELNVPKVKFSDHLPLVCDFSIT